MLNVLLNNKQNFRCISVRKFKKMRYNKILYIITHNVHTVPDKFYKCINFCFIYFISLFFNTYFIY